MTNFDDCYRQVRRDKRELISGTNFFDRKDKKLIS
jgi:hypothetical protein